MMNEKEFYKSIEENIAEYLPPDYAFAKVALTTQVKNNDIERTGLTIRLPRETASPVIYLNFYYDQYQSGRSMDDILLDIADARKQASLGPAEELAPSFLEDYENIRGKLQMRIYDTEKNQKRLEGIVHHCYGDYTAAYAVVFDSDPERYLCALVTQPIMDMWGITKKTLHEDTIRSDLSNEPKLISMDDMMKSMFDDSGAVNYLEDGNGPRPDFTSGPMPLFVLTNRQKINGAGLILNPVVQQKVAEILGGSYYVIPSSVHEVLVLPDGVDREMINAKSLGDMCAQVNASVVDPNEVLSGKIAYFDAKEQKLVNAAQYEREHDRDKVPKKQKEI